MPDPLSSYHRWAKCALTTQFIDGVVVGFICGVTLTVVVAVWTAQDRAIVRAAAGPVTQAQVSHTFTRDECVTLYDTETAVRCIQWHADAVRVASTRVQTR